MAGKKKLGIFDEGSSVLDGYANETTSNSKNHAPEPKQPEKKSSVNPISLENLQRNHRPKAPTKYMQVNVFEYEDYLYRMARYNKMTTTKYILSLIQKDFAEHAAEYENLQRLSEFDKPHRESPNKKKNTSESD